VCAADDCDAPHARSLECTNDGSPEQLVSFIYRSVDLPKIFGGKATWCISSKIPLAVLAEQWTEPRMIYGIPPKLEDLDFSDGILRVHISYFAQVDPDIALNVLQNLRLRSIRQTA
jgi:hypothetical protein